ncbi:MAG TPA: hypothetical protein PKY88_09770 [Anaerohalosphaeraceae bacterium]|nr:hypothetical protein [Anaerohalosphaeraceae bacterium]
MNVLIFLCIAFFSILAGCQKGHQKQQPISFDPNATQVVLIDADRFPESMKGIWQNEELGWIFKIDERGYLTRLQHHIGRAKLVAGKTTTIPLINNGQAILEPGPWLVQYDGKTQTVSIEITLKNFLYDVGGDQVKGSSRDVFIGKVPQEGQTTWTAQWITFPKYVASTADKSYVNYELPFEEGSEDQGDIVFEKVDIEKLKGMY